MMIKKNTEKAKKKIESANPKSPPADKIKESGEKDFAEESSRPAKTENQPAAHNRQAGNYYYDDSTGYEIYNPEDDAEDEE